VLDVRRISTNDCNSWAAKFSSKYSATSFNGAIGVMRSVFNVAIESGALHRNPALHSDSAFSIKTYTPLGRC
jgi:site-specific recombinase XerD